MGYSIYQMNGRDCGYGVPAKCDQPDCEADIDRGMGFCCGGAPDAEYGCHLYFCSQHLMWVDFTNNNGEQDTSPQVCDNCALSLKIGSAGENWKLHPATYEPKPDALQWVVFKLNHSSWHQWRLEHPKEVMAMAGRLDKYPQMAKAIYEEFKEAGEL